MQHFDLVGKTSLKATDHLSRERDLRHKYDRRESTLQAPSHCAEIELRFSAAGDAVDQDRFRIARLQRLCDRLPSPGLLRGQIRDGRGNKLRCDERRSGIAFFKETAFYQGGKGGAIAGRARSDVGRGIPAFGVMRSNALPAVEICQRRALLRPANRVILMSGMSRT